MPAAVCGGEGEGVRAGGREGQLPPESRQTKERRLIKNMGLGRLLLYQPSSTALVDVGFYIYPVTGSQRDSSSITYANG